MIRLKVLPRGPRATTLRYFERCGVQESSDGETLSHPVAGACRWFCCPDHEFAHFLKVLVRNDLLSEAQRRRRRRRCLLGVVEADIDTTVKLWRSDNVKVRAEHASIITDGVGTMEKKCRAGVSDSPRCRACGECVETLCHIWHECAAWRSLRHMPTSILGAWQLMPAYARDCLIRPATASPDMKRGWPQLQLQCYQILRQRNLLGEAQGWVGGPPPPPPQGQR